MSTGNIKVNIGADVSGLRAGVQNAITILNAFNRQTVSSSAQMNTLTGATKSFGDSLYRVTATISLMKGAIQNVYSVTGQWAAGILKTNAYFEKSTYLMKGFSQAADATTRWKEAEDNVKWIRDFSKTTPFALDSVMDAAVRLKSVGLDPMTGSLRAMTDAVAASGKGQVELERAMLAMQQIVGKGKVSMEEIRQQMAEAIPRSMELWARSMNMTIAEFTDAVSKGMVLSEGSVRRFLHELTLTFGGAGQNLMQSFEGRVRVLSTTWQEFQLKIGETKNQSGESFFGEAKKSLLELTNLLQSSEFTAFAQQIGVALTAVTKGTTDVVRGLLSVKTEAIAVGVALVAAFISKNLASFIIGINTALTGLTTQLMLTGVGFQGLGIQAQVAAGHVTFASTALGALGTAARFAATALGWVRVAFMSLTVIGGVIALVWEGVRAINALRGARASLSEEAGRSRGFVGDEKAQTEANIKAKVEETAALREQLKVLEKQKLVQSNKNVNTQYAEAQLKQTTELKTQIAKNVTEINTLVDRFAAATAINQKEQVSADVAIKLGVAQENLANRRQIYNQEMAEAAKRLANATTENQRKAEQDNMELTRKRAVTNQLADIDREYTNANAEALKARAENRERDAEAWAETAKKLKEDRTQQELILNQPIPTVAESTTSPKTGGGGGGGGRKKKTGDGAGSGAQSPGERKFETMDIREHATRAGLLAELEGRSPTAARIIEQYDQGMYNDKSGKPPSKERLEEIIKVAEETDKLREAVERKHEVDNAAKNAEKEIADQYKENTFLLGEYEKILQDVGAVRDKELINFDQIQAKEMEAVKAKGDLVDIVSTQEAQQTTRLAFVRQLSRSRTIDLYDSTKELARSLMDEADAAREVANEDIQRTEVLLHLNELTAQQRVEAEKFLVTYKKMRMERLARDTETPIEKQFRDWAKYQQNMQEAGAHWIDSMSNSLTTFVTTGKLEFKDLANSIISDITRIGIQASASKVFNLIGQSGFDFGGLGKLFGGSGGGGGDDVISGGIGVDEFHTGGMVNEFSRKTMVDSSVFEQARRYHKGHLNLRPNEVPAVLTRDESVLTPGQLRALGGKRDAPAVQVNVINQTNQPVSAQSGTPRLEPNKWVLDVVLKNAAQPGSFRDGLKGALAL